MDIRRAAAVLLSVSMLCIGCARQNMSELDLNLQLTEQTSAPTVSSSTVKEQTSLRLPVLDSGNHNPFATAGEYPSITPLLYQSLYLLDEEYRPYPLLAESISYEEDGYVCIVTVREDVLFSDGTPVTADNYLAYLLAFSTAVARSAGATGMAGQAYTGYADFFNYAGDGVKVDPDAPASREFTGLRRLSESSFSLEVDGAAGYYPYFYTASYAAVTPYDLGLLLGEGVHVRDDGNGCYLDDAWYEQTSSGSSDSLLFKKAEHMKKARYDTETYPYSGPYTIASWD